MRTTKTTTYEIELGLRLFKAEVDITGEYDPGIHTYLNGDPGYPPSEDRYWKLLSILEDDEDGNWHKVSRTDEIYDSVMDEIEKKVNDEDLDYEY